MSFTFDQKIDNFTELLIKSAEKLGCRFIQDSGEGHDLETDTLYLEDVSGWLVPIDIPNNEAKKTSFTDLLNGKRQTPVSM